jgi:hypothetical protein
VLQHPLAAPQAVASHTQVALAPLPEHFMPVPHAAPVEPHTHAPLAQTFAVPAALGHATPAPHSQV